MIFSMGISRCYLYLVIVSIYLDILFANTQHLYGHFHFFICSYSWCFIFSYEIFWCFSLYLLKCIFKFSFHLPSHFINSSKNIRNAKSSTTTTATSSATKESIEPIKWFYVPTFR